MKGLVFTEYLDFIESKFGYELVDRIVTSSNLTDDGAFTSVGNYPFQDMVSLLTETQINTSLSIDQLLFDFGQHVMQVFIAGFPQFFDEVNDAFVFLSSIEDRIHPEVLKLYPDAELPTFQITHHTRDRLVMNYKSVRKMSDFAHGLMVGCFDYFKEEAHIEMENLNEDGSVVRFTIHR